MFTEDFAMDHYNRTEKLHSQHEMFSFGGFHIVEKRLSEVDILYS